MRKTTERWKLGSGSCGTAMSSPGASGSGIRGSYPRARRERPESSPGALNPSIEPAPALKTAVKSHRCRWRRGTPGRRRARRPGRSGARPRRDAPRGDSPTWMCRPLREDDRLSTLAERADPYRSWASDSRMVALMRVVLAVSGLAVVTLVPAGPEHLSSPVSLALVAYGIYSIAVWVLEIKRLAPFRGLSDWGHWIDVACFTILIALSRGTVSIFFWYFFPILVASFRWGFWSGIRVVAISTILFSTVGFLSAPPVPEVEQQRFLIRPIYFITVGYMMAYWGG